MARRAQRQTDDEREEEVDRASEESFPASDPPAHTPMTGAGHHNGATATRKQSGKAWLAGWGALAVALAAGVWTFRRSRG